MYISRVEIPWSAARNPYDFHRQLWRLFPGELREIRRACEENRQSFLFRIEKRLPGCPARLLVQSRRSPDATVGLAVLGSREFDPEPIAGQRLAFLLTANPIKTITDTQRESKPGKKAEKCRVPLLREEEQRDWLARKLDGAAEVEAVSVLPHPPLYFRKGGRGGKLVTVTFEGVLRVLDGPALGRQLQNGVGPAKGFGCGLMLVKRA